MKKQWLALLMGTTLVVGLTACGGGEDAEPTSGEQPQDEIVEETPNEATEGETEGAAEETSNEATEGEAEGTSEETTEDAAAPASINVAAAEETYAASCTSCHGNALDQGGIGPALDTVGSKYSEEEILDILVNGTNGGMPGGLIRDEADAANVAAWLATQK